MDIGAIFLEEAKEHLDTIEKGLLDLQATMQDSERVNEMFRAAHSVKGGAAMLGFGSIQTVAHRMEDYFKVLKENDVQVDQKAESLFLQCFDRLTELVELLQSPQGLQPEEGNQVVKKAEPTFIELQAHLEALAGGAATEPVALPDTVAPDLVPQTLDVLRQMLHVFKQTETPATRKQLDAACLRLAELGEGLSTWQNLVKTCRRAISGSENTFVALAPPVIKELKQASEMAIRGKAEEIAPSSDLRKLAASAELPEVCIPQDLQRATGVLLKSFDRSQLVKLVKSLARELKS